MTSPTLFTPFSTVFACMSKACAPPPVGSGGSLRTTGGTVPSASSKKWVPDLFRDVPTAVALADGLGDHEEAEQLSKGMKVAANRAVVAKLASDPEFKAFVERNMDRKVFGSFAAPLASMNFVHWDSTKVRDSTLGEIVEAARAARTFKNMSAEEIVATLVVRPVIDAWAEDATSNASIPSQLAAADMHNVSSSSYREWSMSGKNALNMDHRNVFERVESEMDDETMSLQKMIVRAEYEATQDWFREQGIKSITVYRGVRREEGSKAPSTGETVEVEGNPLSSWTTDRAVAEQFAGYNLAQGVIYSQNGTTLAMDVPVEMVQSTPYTGRGCLTEHEIVLINRQPSMAEVVSAI